MQGNYSSIHIEPLSLPTSLVLLALSISALYCRPPLRLRHFACTPFGWLAAKRFRFARSIGRSVGRFVGSLVRAMKLPQETCSPFFLRSAGRPACQPAGSNRPPILFVPLRASHAPQSLGVHVRQTGCSLCNVHSTRIRYYNIDYSFLHTAINIYYMHTYAKVFLNELRSVLSDLLLIP